MAFGHGNDTLAITLFASLPELAHRIGGSHAQRDVLHLTLLHAIEGIRRPARRLRTAPCPCRHRPDSSRQGNCSYCNSPKS